MMKPVLFTNQLFVYNSSSISNLHFHRKMAFHGTFHALQLLKWLNINRIALYEFSFRKCQYQKHLFTVKIKNSKKLENLEVEFFRIFSAKL